MNTRKLYVAGKAAVSAVSLSVVAPAKERSALMSEKIDLAVALKFATTQVNLDRQAVVVAEIKKCQDEVAAIHSKVANMDVYMAAMLAVVRVDSDTETSPSIVHAVSIVKEHLIAVVRDIANAPVITESPYGDEFISTVIDLSNVHMRAYRRSYSNEVAAAA